MRFDIFHEIGKKYLAADALTQFKTKFLYTLCLVFRELFVLIRQNLHGTVTDIDQVDQRFNSFTAPHHITAERPERFLLIVSYFNISPK